MKCNVKECFKKPILGVDKCKYCNHSYCLSHRLIETHNCKNMDTCKKALFDKNSNILLRNKCVSNKIDAI